MLSTSPDRSAPALVPVRSVHIGSRLRLLRQQARLTQEDIARKLGIDESIPSRWECEEATRYRPVPANRLESLASILGTTVEDLAPEALDVPPELDDPGATNKDVEAGIPLGMLTAADLFMDSQPQAAAPLRGPHLLQYTTGSYLPSDSYVPRPTPGRPRLEDAEDGQVAHMRLRCPWCGFLHERTVAPAATYDQDPLPESTCWQCGRQMRARVRVSVQSEGAQADDAAA